MVRIFTYGRPDGFFRALDQETPHHSTASSDLLSKLANGLDSAISTLEQMKRATLTESQLLTKLAKDYRFQIKYIGDIGDQIGQIHHNIPDFRQNLLLVAANLRQMRDTPDFKGRELREIKMWASSQMEDPEAASQLGSWW